MAKLPPWWTHYAVGARTRDEAVEQMFDDYDRQRGSRRKPARDAFEVYRARHERAGPWGAWILYVRRRRAP